MSLADQSLQFFPVSARVSVLRARGLRIKGKDGTNDAYTALQAGRETFRTPVAEKLAEPVWGGNDAAFIFTLPADSARTEDGVPLQVRVFHRVPLGADKLLGLTVVNVHELRQNSARENPQWFKLLNKAGKADKARGEVLLDIQFLKSSMSVSMIDLSDKSHSRLGKFKDKLRGKKKDGLSDSASAILPSVSQILTDSEGEMDGETEGESTKKKKNKLKSLFVPKSNMKRNSLSQSMSSLKALPDKNSSISSSTSSGLNVDSSEGKKKKKFTFLTHKRNGSTDSKASNHSDLTFGSANQNPPPQTDICVNGSHVYREQNQPEEVQEMEEDEEGENEEEEESWSREEEEQKRLEEEKRREIEEERMRKEKEQHRKEEEEKERVRHEREKEEQRRRKEEEENERMRMERVKEEERRRMEDQEKERIRIEKEREEHRRKMAEEKERIRMEREKEEEERRRMEEKEKEMIRMEREKEEQRRKMAEEKERIRIEREKEEQRRRMEEEEKERIRMEREKEEQRRRMEEEEKERIRMEREKEEQRRRMEEEDKERIRMEREKEEQRRRMDKEEKERIRMEREKEEQRRRMEEEEKERIRMEKETKEQRRRIEEEEKERIRMEREKEEQQRRINAEERERPWIEKGEEKRKLEEEESMRMKREKEEQMRRLEEEQKKKAVEAEVLRRKMAEEKDRKRAEEDEKMRIAEEERKKEEKKRAERERMMEEEKKLREEKRIETERRLANEKKAREEEERKVAEEKEKQRKEEQVREEKERKRRKEEEQELRNKEMEERKKKERLGMEETLFEESVISQSTDFTRSARISAKPSVSVSQASMVNSNPFWDDDLDAGVFISVEERTAKKGHALLPPQLTGPNVAFGGAPKQLSHSKEVSKRQAPQPPGLPKMTSFDLGRKERQHESNILSVSQDDNQVLTNPFTCDEPVPVKHKRPAPKPGSGISVSKDVGNILTERTSHLEIIGSASSIKDNPPNDITVEDVRSDLTYELSKREERLEHIVEPDTAKPNAPSFANWDLFPEPVVCRTEELPIMERSQRKSRAPLPPSKPKRTGDHSTQQQQQALTYKTNFEQAQENASVSSMETPANNAPTLSTVSSSTFTSLHDKSGLVETGSGSRWGKVVPNDAGEVREEVAPTSVIRQHAVKPLSTAQKQPETHESRVTDKTQPNTKAVEEVMKGPYSQLTQAELISLVLRQQEQISQRDTRIKELEQYIDNLVVRVMEEKPSILMNLNTKNKSM
ncbi:putative autophagy-related protein 11 isoform X1 [Tachysurus fulvidraco]|uniref:putative autophagy-related protein 11 isoform X1 n=1 Tax=Tachysurus fulvidraco TaxID=1234273 RepID=UPI001FED3AA9|nr:putative autophagy-related protein 11 isoform X1 [Tachysurus fulvidraco]